MPDEPLDGPTIADLLKRHEEEKAAIRKEFEDDATDDVTKANADKRVASLAPDAWAALQWIVNNAQSESARLSASKYILDVTMGKKVQPSESRAIEDLIESLKPK